MNKKYSYIFFGLLLFLLYFSSKVDNSKNLFLMKNTKYETEIYYIDNDKKTKVLIISGIHGNEIAGINATEKIIEQEPNCAEFIAVPKANTEAINLKQRNPYYMSDLNRAFPGKVNGTDTEKIAYAIFELIKKEKPHLVIDLHEWEKTHDEDSRVFSNGLIVNAYNSRLYKSVEKVYNDYVLNNNSKKIMLNTSSVEGSLNKEVSEILDIPVLTIESNLNDDLVSRIDFHLFVIENIIKNLEMDD